MPELEINNIPIDTSDAKIVLNKMAYPDADFISRKVTFSERVRVPRIPFVKFDEYYPFKYKDAGKIVFSGKSQLLSRFANNVDEMQLLDSAVELFTNIDGKLNELELDSEDFTFNSTAYTNLKTLNSSIWIWSAATNHVNRTLAKNILSGNLAFSRPFFSVKRLVEKMFSANGWLYELSTNTALFDKLIISSNSEQFLFTSFEKTYSGLSISVSGTTAINITTPDFLKTDTITGTNTLNANYTSSVRFRGWIESSANVTLQIVGVSSAATDSKTDEFLISKGRFYYDLNSGEFETDDAWYALTFNLVGSGTVIFEDFRIYTIIEEGAFGDVSLANFVDFRVKAYDNIPDFGQKEVFKNCLVMVGGFFTSDNFRKKLKINSLNEPSKLSALDWSAKYIEDSQEERALLGFGKLNYFAFDNDNSKGVALGRGSFDIENQTLPDLKEVFKSIFAASNEVVVSKTQIDMPVYSDVERVAELNAIIGYYEVESTYTIARFENLNGDRILFDYYTNFLNAIKQGKLFEANFNLNKSDFFLFDFTKLIYVKQLKSTFYLLEIGEYSEGEVCKLLILKA
jgi:hypothetical protein